MAKQISFDTEIETFAIQAGEALQEIQSRLGRRDHASAKVRFPRGFLHPASRWRQRLSFIRQETVKNNVAYTLMLHDANLWLLRRTDLAGLARDMVVKACLAALGSIAEAILVDHYAGKMGMRQRFVSRTDRLFSENVISLELKKELDWLWEMRCRQHLFELTDAEFEFYGIEDHKRGIEAISNLFKALTSRSV